MKAVWEKVTLATLPEDRARITARAKKAVRAAAKLKAAGRSPRDCRGSDEHAAVIRLKLQRGRSLSHVAAASAALDIFEWAWGLKTPGARRVQVNLDNGYTLACNAGSVW